MVALALALPLCCLWPHVAEQLFAAIDAGAETYHITLNADRGMSWEAALAYREASAQELTDAGRPLSGAAGFWIDSRVGARGQGQTGL